MVVSYSALLYQVITSLGVKCVINNVALTVTTIRSVAVIHGYEPVICLKMAISGRHVHIHADKNKHF